MNKIDKLIATLDSIYELLEQLPLGSTGHCCAAIPEEKMMTRQEVKDYLNISESTYKRKVKDGTLKPIAMPGGDRFYKSQLLEAFLESGCGGYTCTFFIEKCPALMDPFVNLNNMDYAG